MNFTLEQLATGSKLLGPYMGNPRAKTDAPAGRARAIMSAAYQTVQGLSVQMPLIEQIKDSDLSPEGLVKAKEDRLAMLLAVTAQRIRSLGDHLVDAVKDAETAAAPFRPIRDDENLAQLARTDQAWNNTIRPQLDAGKDWDLIINTLDHDGIIATQRFAPGHEAGKRGRNSQHEVPVVLAGIKTMSDRRVIALAPEGAARDALTEAADVAHVAEVAVDALASLASVDGPRNVMGAAISVKRATYEVGAQPGAQPGA